MKTATTAARVGVNSFVAAVDSGGGGSSSSGGEIRRADRVLLRGMVDRVNDGHAAKCESKLHEDRKSGS
jgi:hypothetical protein